MRAARRVRDAIESGGLADPEDAIMMNIYQASLELRRVPNRARLGMAQRFARQLIANTRESMD